MVTSASSWPNDGMIGIGAEGRDAGLEVRRVGLGMFEEQGQVCVTKCVIAYACVFWYVCVCVCVCVRARARVRVFV